MHLNLQHISVRYDNADGTHLEAVRDVSLEVDSGQAVALIGPSGCGKSTLLRIACGLLKPTEGAVSIDGEALAGPRSATALILQDFGLLPWKTVYKNAELGLRRWSLNFSASRGLILSGFPTGEASAVTGLRHSA